jgi:hypothetical protein
MNIIATLIGWGVPARFAKPLLYGVGAVLLCLVIWGAVKIHDHRVIATHEAQQEAATAKADRQADTTAAVQRRADDATLTNETTAIKEAVNEAGPDPAARRSAYYDCVRKQQAARRDSKLSASC